jgi:hypothetical protein
MIFLFVKYPNLLRALLGLPTTTQLKDGFIRLRGFPSHWPLPPQDKSHLGLTQPPQADSRLPQELLLLVEIVLWTYVITAYFAILAQSFP